MKTKNTIHRLKKCEFIHLRFLIRPDWYCSYGPDVETLVQEEDAQPLSEPIIAPVKVRNWVIEEKGLPETRFDKRFLLDLMSFPEMIRNVAVVGHLHHGKTSLIDTLVFETHKMVWDSDKQVCSAICLFV
jgi:U5 small nuclear ribonucleoprotein component